MRSAVPRRAFDCVRWGVGADMRTFTLGNLLLGCLLIAGTASAQYRDGYGQGRGYYPERYGRYDRYPGTGPVNRALADIRDTRFGWDSHGVRKHLDRAERDLLRFEDRWSRGRFDRGALDGAIENLADAVNSRGLAPRERDVLSRDLWSLRDFRSRQGRY